VKFAESKSNLESLLRECHRKSLSVQEEIYKAKSVKEFCPTCGRKFDNVFIPDTTELESTLLSTQKEYEELSTKLNGIKSEYNNIIISINDEMNK
jgi:hypothetical protein